VLDTT